MPALIRPHYTYKEKRSHYLYRCWTHIQSALYSQNYTDHKYAAKLGLGCDWTDFWDFAEDIELVLGPKPTPQHRLTRKNMYKGWHLNNLDWSTIKEQGQRIRNAHYITIGKETRNLQGWCDHLGIPYWVAVRRFHKGYTGKDIFQPSRRKSRK